MSRFHMIFSNWLLMYLNDLEVLELVERSLRSIKEDGFMFFRESCFHQSGNCTQIKLGKKITDFLLLIFFL
jgi:hypothetical protein